MNLLISLLALPALAQDAPVRLDKNVIPPRLTSRVEPEYSGQARQHRVQATVVVEVIIDSTGRIASIDLIRPAGFGLDQKVLAAVSLWTFEPALRDGRPISVRMPIELNFRTLDGGTGIEARQLVYEDAIEDLQKPDKRQHALAELTKMAEEKYPLALYELGRYYRRGMNVPKDVAQAAELFRQAAEISHAPAMFELAMMMQKGEGMPADAGASQKMLEQAAELGSQDAQHRLATTFAAEGQTAKARHYFRLCAAAGSARCQYRLAKSIFDLPVPSESEIEQALAWCRIAALQGDSDAQQLWERESGSAKPDVLAAAARLRRIFEQ